MLDARLMYDIQQFPHKWDTTKGYEVIEAGLVICWDPPNLRSDYVAMGKHYRRDYMNPDNWLHLIRKDRGIRPRFKVASIPYLRRSISDAIS